MIDLSLLRSMGRRLFSLYLPVLTLILALYAHFLTHSAVFAMPVGKMLSYFGLVPSGSILDVPNAALGILFYSWQLLLGSKRELTDLTHLITVGAMASSVFLAYQLTFVIVELCLLCWTTHVVNSILTYKMIQTRKATSSSKVKGL
jgi:uncharacterized membrane protein